METRKGAVSWGGAPTDAVGPELKVGDKAPSNFTLVDNGMKPVTGADLAGKPRILVTVPSLDTPVCDIESRRFNELASQIPGLSIEVISVDLPFAQKRWCGNAGIDKVRTLSDYKDRSFGPSYGVFVPSKALLFRTVFVIGADDVIKHIEFVADVKNEPNYDAALAAAKALV